nr:RISC-loading complex subunit TARBP2-like isoform X2 [Nomia melanderi]
MIKTPVSVLQEMMVKNQSVPNYELIHDGGGTHMNTFTYQVTCDGLIAVGTGRSKKDAKHEAAKAMIEAITAQRGYPQLPASPSQSPLRTPLPPVIPETERLPPNVPFVNAVGALKEVCDENNLQEPEYVQISDVGPPHAKIFTFECLVANFKETGIARTKKQAKQEAAKKMLHKIIDLIDDVKDTDFYQMDSKDNEDEDDSSAMAKSLYPTLSRLPSTKKVNLGLKLSEYHIQLKKTFNVNVCNDLIEKLKSLIPHDHSNVSKEFVEQLELSLKNVLSTVEIEVTLMDLDCTKTNSYCKLIKFNTSPETVQIATGQTEEQATFSVLLNSINFLICLLQ